MIPKVAKVGVVLFAAWAYFRVTKGLMTSASDPVRFAFVVFSAAVFALIAAMLLMESEDR